MYFTGYSFIRTMREVSIRSSPLSQDPLRNIPCLSKPGLKSRISVAFLKSGSSVSS